MYITVYKNDDVIETKINIETFEDLQNVGRLYFADPTTQRIVIFDGFIENFEQYTKITTCLYRESKYIVEREELYFNIRQEYCIFRHNDKSTEFSSCGFLHI